MMAATSAGRSPGRDCPPAPSRRPRRTLSRLRNPAEAAAGMLMLMPPSDPPPAPSGNPSPPPSPPPSSSSSAACGAPTHPPPSSSRCWPSWPPSSSSSSSASSSPPPPPSSSSSSSSSPSLAFLLLAAAAAAALLPTGDGQNLVTEDVTVVEGDVATISCRVKNSDDSVIQLLNPNRQTIYFRDFRPLKDSRFQLVNFSSSELRVSLTNVSISDEGRYFCQLYTDPPQEYYMTITVLVPPRNLRIEYQKETAVEGEEIELNCTAMASRPATTIRWFKGSKPLPAGKAEVEQWSDMYTVTSQLSLKVKREDDGVPVVCQADHPAVKDMQAKYYLEVLYKPEVQVLQNSPGQPLTREGDLLDLLCQVKGKPEPVDVTWVRVDDEMPQHIIVSGSNLHIDSLNKSDNGTYRCEASNEVGTSFSDYTLYVYDNPTTLPPPTTTTTTTTTIPTTTTAADTTATTEPAVHGFTQLPNSAEELEHGDLSDSRAGEESAITAVDHAVIGGVVAVVVFAMLCLLIILGRYFARHKGTYFTHEAKGADDAADADTAIINAEGGQNNSEEKKEYFI